MGTCSAPGPARDTRYQAGRSVDRSLVQVPMSEASEVKLEELSTHLGTVHNQILEPINPQRDPKLRTRFRHSVIY